MAKMFGLMEAAFPLGLHVNGASYDSWFHEMTFSPRALAASPLPVMHAYPYWSGSLKYGGPMDPPSTRLLPAFAALIRSYAGDAGKPVWAAEFNTCIEDLPEKQQAVWLEKAVTEAVAAGVCWFTYWDSHDTNRKFKFNTLEYSLGLFTNEGQLKQQGRMFKQLARMYSGKPVVIPKAEIVAPPTELTDQATWAWLLNYLQWRPRPGMDIQSNPPRDSRFMVRGIFKVPRILQRSIHNRLYSYRPQRLQQLLLLLTLMAVVFQSLPTNAQGTDTIKELSGEWFGLLEKMDNGEQNQLVVQLQQHGKELQGNFHTRGFGSDLKGSIEDGKITLFRADRKNRYIYGEVLGKDLHIFFYEHPVTLHPLGPDDLKKIPAYIPVPSLHRLPPNGLARTPPMGWNSWNQFSNKVDDATIRTIADAMVSTGMRDAGYVYLNIDDSWEGLRDSDGVLQLNHKFPDMKALSLEGLLDDPGLTQVLTNRARYQRELAREPALNALDKRNDEAAKLAGTPAPRHSGHGSPSAGLPTGLYNGMIAPLTSISVKGFIWYQGEADSSQERAPYYASLFPSLIRDWRGHFSQSDLPFIYAQLSSFDGSPGWPRVQDAQHRALELRNTAMAMTADVGDAKNIHPPDKQTVAQRMELAARALAYGEQIAYEPPLFRQAAPIMGEMQVWFDHADGLTSTMSPIAGFEVAGPDHHFFPADAEIDGTSVRAHSKSVPDPRFVRYAWTAIAPSPLRNAIGLPASAFTSEEEFTIR